MQPATMPQTREISSAPAFKPTEREQKLLLTLYRFEGVLADYQIKQLFFDSYAWMENRLKLLCDGEYLYRFNLEQRALLPYTAYLLDRKGIDFVASVEGVPIRLLKWRKPGEGLQLIPHDVELNDLRISVNRAIKTLPGGQLTQWVNSRMLKSKPDVIEMTAAATLPYKRKIISDGFFFLTYADNGTQRKRRYLIEYDRQTEQNPRFIEDKVIPGIAYIKSEVFKRRYGVSAGDWLVVTKSDKRMKNMLKAAASIADADKYFYYTTYSQATAPDAFFKAAIWWQPGADQATALVT